MNKRMLSSIIFSIIVAFELFLYIGSGTPTKTESTFFPKTNDSSWGAAKTVENVVIDTAANDANNKKYGIIILTTILVGALVTFNIPNEKTKKEDHVNIDLK